MREVSKTFRGLARCSSKGVLVSEYVFLLCCYVSVLLSDHTLIVDICGLAETIRDDSFY